MDIKDKIHKKVSDEENIDTNKVYKRLDTLEQKMIIKKQKNLLKVIKRQF